MPISFDRRLRSAVLTAALALAALAASGAARASAADYVPGEVVVGYGATAQPAAVTADIARRAGVHAASVSTTAPDLAVVHLSSGASVDAAIARLRRRPGVAYAVPNFIAHADSSYLPDDPGTAHRTAGWEALQWNFLPVVGVNAIEAWANLIADGRPGGRGVTVAILDTGVAYRDWRQYKESPDFAGTQFVAPYDFIDNTPYPLDREGHGTFVAGTVAEATNNGLGLTGLAYGASIMPVRVLESDGTGDAATISRGIRYAVSHGAQVINLSLEFSLDVTPNDIPDIISAIHYAHQHGVVVVAAAGNEGVEQLAYPARASESISVGATTKDRCLADYSNGGRGLDLVAPGGGDDTSLLLDPNCHPNRNLPTIYQMTFKDSFNPAKFGYPQGIYGTSMAAPHVSAAAALVIASGTLGKHPTPAQVLSRLEATAQELGGSKPNANYGYGLLDAGAATAPLASPASKR